MEGNHHVHQYDTNSRKAWKTIRKQTHGPTTSSPPCLVSEKQVAHQLLVNERGNIPSTSKRPVLPPATEGDTSMIYIFIYIYIYIYIYISRVLIVILSYQVMQYYLW